MKNNALKCKKCGIVIKEGEPIISVESGEMEIVINDGIAMPLNQGCEMLELFHKKCYEKSQRFFWNNIDKWIISRSTGTSSITLWIAMKGLVPDDTSYVGVPLDNDDFGRCYNLMQIATPSEREIALKNVDIICPDWKPIARDWDKLVKLYEKALDTNDYCIFNSTLDKLINESKRNKNE